MAYGCSDCGMDFETTAQLANHKKKFCLGAQGSEEAIEKRLEELKRLEHDLDYSFDATKVNRPSAPVSQPPTQPSARSQANTQVPQPQPQQPLPPTSNAGPAAGYPTQQQQQFQQPPPMPMAQYYPQPQPYPFPVNIGAPMQASAGPDPYMADQIRRLEQTIQRQEDRLNEERAKGQEIRAQFKNDLDRIKEIQSQVPIDPSVGAYPSQNVQQANLDDQNDEALMQKLNELEGYLATNPNKYQQMQNPMGLFGIQQPQVPLQQATQMQPGVQMVAQPSMVPGTVPGMVPAFNVQYQPTHDPYYFNILQNPSGNRMLDDLERAYKLRQDVDRCDDLESEEKAMVNLASQEYDAMKILSTIPEHSDLYKFKLEQYKQVSNARAKAEIYLQEQRLNRLNKNFEMQSKNIERRFRHDEWMEEQKRNLFVHKVADLANGGPTNQSVNTSLNPPQDANWQVKPTNLLDSVKLNVEQQDSSQAVPEPEIPQLPEEEGSFDIYFDTIFGAPLDIKDCELCFCLQRNQQVLSTPQPCLVKMNHINPDMANPDFVRINFVAKHEYREIEAPCNLIVEVRKFDPAIQQSLKSVAWTIISLFDPAGDLNVGKWRAPMFKCPTKLGSNIEIISQEMGYSGLDLAIRIASPGDKKQDVFQPTQAVKSHYRLAHYHAEQQGAGNISSSVDQITPVPSPPPDMNLNQRPSLNQSNVTSDPLVESQIDITDHQGPTPQPELMQPEEEVKQMPVKQPTVVPKLQMPEPAPQKDPNYLNKGIKLIVHYARMPQHYQNLYVQGTLYLGKQIITLQSASQANWITKEIGADEVFEVDQNAQIDVSREGIQIKKTQQAYAAEPRSHYVFPSNEVHTWKDNFYEIAWDNNLADRILLLVQCLTKDRVTQKMTPLGYFVHDLLNVDGKIKFGTYTTPLLMPPISFRDLDENPSPRLDAQVNFSILDPDQDRENTAQFIPNNEKQYTATEFWKESEEEGVDIYIDALRHFPENVTIVKVVAKVVDHMLQDLLRPRDIWPKLRESSYQNQTYHCKLECRGVAMMPTALLHLSFITIDATTLKEKLIGFSFFPLFINSSSKMPVLPEDEIDLDNDNVRALHKGAYQMPIYCEYPPVTGTLTYKNFIRLERIPTASILIRIDYASIDFDGNFISINDADPKMAALAFEPAPKYSEQTYSTTYFISTEVEREVFQLRKVRQTDAPLKEVLEAICEVTGKQFGTDKDMMDYFKTILGTQESLSLLDLIFFSAYESKIGFRYNLESLNGLQNEGNKLWQVMSSVVPPASPYQDNNRSMFAAFPFSLIDWQSKMDHVQFIEDDIVMNNIALWRSSAIIFDISSFDIQTKQMQRYGFAIYPLIKTFQTRNYFASGVQVLPVYRGAVPRKLTDILSRNTNVDPMALLQKMREDREIDYAGEAYCVVKAVDSQRHSHFLRSLAEIIPSQRFLNDHEKLQFQYKASARSARVLQNLVPDKNQQAQIQKQITEQFAQYLNTF